MAPSLPKTSAQTHSQSLWDRAFDALSKDTRSTLNQAITHKRDILAAVLKVAEERRAVSLRKRWKFQKSNGEVVIIRDVLEKITTWIDRFKAVGDVAVQFDATHASLPWTAVRFLLQVTVNDVQKFGTMVQDLEVISRILVRYKEFELLYLSQNSPVHPALENALIGLYTDILLHLARTIDYFSESSHVRLAKSVFRSGDDTHIQKIMTQEVEVLKLAKLKDAETLHFLETAVLRLRDQSNNNVRLLDEERRVKMIRWLSTSPCHLHHETISQPRTPNFGQWLLKHKKYRDWCQTSSSSVLWVHGIPGSGKTHLCSVIVDSLLTNVALHPTSTPFAYFYCLRTESEPERSSVNDILRTLLRQLAITATQGDVHDLLFTEFDRRSKSAQLQGLELPRLTGKECVDLIIEVANEDPITIILDAVDQVEEDHRYALYNALVRIMTEAGNVVKVFFTSRNDNEVHSVFPLAREIVVTPENTRNDMEDFILRKIDDSRLLGGKLSSTMRASLACTLLNGADEMFLWAQHQIQQLRLRKIKREEDLLPALETNVLSDLDELYEVSLSQIIHAGNATRQLAIQIFSWLIYMKSPLTPSALLTAIMAASTGNMKISLTDISDLCSHLVIIDMDRDMIRFAHQSIQEYLLRVKPELFSPSVSHGLLASTCISIISRGPPINEALATQVKSFYFYAVTYWATHFKNSQVVNENEELFQQMLSFVFEDEDTDVSLSFEVWVTLCTDIVTLLPDYHPMKPALDAIPNDTSSALFLAAIFGIDGLLTLLAEPERETDWDQRNMLGQTAIYLAASLGHVSAVSFLIGQGAEVNVECGRYGSPLHTACFTGHVQVVETLLRAGASRTCGTKFENALDAGFHGGQEGITLYLIRHGSSILSEKDYEWAADMAAQYGFCKAMEELQKPTFASFRQKGKLDRQKTRMAKAIKGGQVGVLQQFLNISNPSVFLPKDAVAIAAINGHNDVIEFLLDKGMSIDVEGSFGTPLRSASLTSRKTTVQLLLERGADVKMNESKGNALYVAAVKGHLDIVKMLTQNGAGVNQKTGSFGTVLQAAAYNGHGNIVEFLVDAGADVHATGYSRDAFHAAAEGGHQDIIMLLLRKGYKFRHTPPGPMYSMATPSRYRQLFREASPGRQRHPGSSVNDSNSITSSKSSEIGQDNLNVTIEGNLCDIESSELLIAANFSKKQRPSFAHDENYPLEAAAAAGREEVVRVLLDLKKVLGISNKAVKNAINAATTGGHLDTVKLLVESVTEQGSTKEYLSSILNATGSIKPEISQYALDKASESGIAEDEVDQMRLRMPPGPEKYKSASIDKNTIRADFLESCHSGDIAALSSILECKYNSFLRPRHIASGLKLAAQQGHESICTSLLDRTFNHRNRELSNNDLVRAVSSNLDVLKILSLREKDWFKFPGALGLVTFVSCCEGHPKVVEYLITNMGVDVNAEIPEDDQVAPTPPDFWLSRRGRHHRRFESSSSCESDSQSVLGEEGIAEGKAQEAKAVEQVRLISPLQVALRAFKATSRYGEPEVMEAGERLKREEVIALLLKHGANPNAIGGQQMSPIQLAVSVCSDLVVMKLLEAGANVTLKEEGVSVLAAVVERELESASIIRRLLDAGATFPTDVGKASSMLEKVLDFFRGHTEREYFHDCDDPDGRFLIAPSLSYVFEEGSGAVLEILLRNYDQVKADNASYCLALQMACLLGKKEFVKLLLVRGVNVNGTGYYYGSAIQAAARSGQVEIIELLIGAGANVNILQGRWHTPIRAAIVGGHNEATQLLMEYGADTKLKYRTQRLYVNDGEKASPSSLQLAVQSGNTNLVRTLLAAGSVSVEEDESYLPHPLILGCQQGYFDIVKLLLDADAPINVLGKPKPFWGYISEEDASPLHGACAGNHVSLVEMLLSRGADPNKEVSDCTHATPLLAAVEKGPLIVRLLLDAGADVNYISEDRSKTALSQAVRGENLSTVKMLMAAGAIVAGSSPQPNCLKEACYGGNLAVIELLLESLCSDNSNAGDFIDEALRTIAERGQQNNSIIRLLLDYLSPTLNRFIQVCLSGSVASTMYMLEQGIDVNGKDEESRTHPIQAAARQLNPEIVQILAQQGADVNQRGEQSEKPLVTALQACAAPLLRPFKRKKASGNYPEAGLDFDFAYSEWFDGPAISHKRVQQCTKVVQILVENGATLDADEDDFGDPLHLACLIGDVAMVKFLVNKGAAINVVGGYFRTPLFAAVEGNNADIVSLLLEGRIDVNYVHKVHGTALHFACEKRDQTMVRKLLQHGASATVPNGKGETALSISLHALNDYYSSRSHKDVTLFEIILQNSPAISVNEADIVQAARVPSYQGVLKSLLDADKDKDISENTIVRLLEETKWPDMENLKLLFERRGDSGITERMLMAAPSSSTLQNLLDRYPLACTITPAVLENQSEMGSIELLVRHDQYVEITEAVVVSVLDKGDRYSRLSSGNFETTFLDILWQRNPSLVITKTMIKAAQTAEGLDFLLQRLGPAQGTLQDIAMFVSEEDHYDDTHAKMLSCIIKHDTQIKLTAGMIDNVTSSWNLEPLDDFLTHDPTLPITEKLFTKCFGKFPTSRLSKQLQFAKLLKKHGKKVVFTEKIREAVDSAFQKYTDMASKELFYSLQENGDEV